MVIISHFAVVVNGEVTRTMACLREKVGAFRRETGIGDNCHLTFVTTYGLRRNSHCGMVQSEVTLDDLFRE